MLSSSNLEHFGIEAYTRVFPSNSVEYSAIGLLLLSSKSVEYSGIGILLLSSKSVEYSGIGLLLISSNSVEYSGTVLLSLYFSRSHHAAILKECETNSW
jgi:hypothetical protein